MPATSQTSNNAGTILVVDDSNLCRELVVEALRGHGYTTLSAVDGEMGIGQLEQNHVDAVILDSEMPKMDGMAFLKTIRNDGRWEQVPVVMLTTNVSRELISEAMGHKISGFLLKSKFSMPEMLSRVHTAILRGRATATPQSATKAPSTAPPSVPAKAQATPAPEPAAMKIPNLVNRDTTLAAMVDFKSTKALAGVLGQVASVASAARPSPAEVAAVVRQDPVLAARVVHLAGMSSAAKPKARLASVDDAVRMVGVEAVRDLAASVQGIEKFPTGQADGMDLLKCWSHALAVAAVMGRIVPQSDTLPPLLPQLVGLCHDLAEIVLRQRFPSEFAAAVDFASQGSVPVQSVITAVFGVSYAEITEALFQNLKFPQPIAGPIIEFSVNSGKSIDNHKSLLARSLAIADSLVHGMLLASSVDALVSPVSLADCRTMLIPTSGINFAEVRSEAVTSICMIAKLSTEDESTFLKPLVDRTDAAICFARHSSFAAIDPIFVALSNLGGAYLPDRQQQNADPVNLQKLVVLSPGPHAPFLNEAIRASTQAGKRVPVLHIVSSAEVRNAADMPDGVSEIGHPMSIARLAEFMSDVKRADRA